MIMSAAYLLEQNPNPSEQEVRHGLEGNLCRCTGYQNIVNAVLAAAKAVARWLPSRTQSGIGASVLRKEDAPLITGQGRYVDDITLPGMAFAAFARSAHAHADIKGIDTSAAEAMPGVDKVFTYDDARPRGRRARAPRTRPAMPST